MGTIQCMSDWWNEPGADELCPTSAEWLRVMRQLRPAVAGASGPVIQSAAPEPCPPEPRADDRDAPPENDRAR